jgi:hypothetical protein
MKIKLFLIIPSVLLVLIVTAYNYVDKKSYKLSDDNVDIRYTNYEFVTETWFKIYINKNLSITGKGGISKVEINHQYISINTNMGHKIVAGKQNL